MLYSKKILFTVVGLNLLHVEHLSCFIHTLQLVINDAIFSQRSVKDLIANCRKIVSHFAHSATACHKLENIQGTMGLPKHKLIQDVSTRWNSTLQMLERILEQKTALTNYAADNDIPVLGAYNYQMMEFIIRVLKPFEIVTLMCSSNKEISSCIIPQVATLKKYLSKPGNDSGVQTLKKELESSLDRRFGGTVNNINTDDRFLRISTFLDPRFKDAFFTSSVRETTMKDIVHELLLLDERDDDSAVSAQIELLEASGSEHSRNLSLSEQEQEPKRSLESEINEDFWSCFEGSKREESSDESDNNTQAENERTRSRISSSGAKKKKEFYTAEIHKYMQLPAINRDEDPINWWKKNVDKLASLKPVVLKYLSAPPSSAASERLFSTAGHICNDLRNRLLPDNADRLIFVSSNRHLL